ncbi:nuclear transport factor 2 family protein [Pseudidiomarina halophila]|uniref:nuclear transport factor 2 family protein n=1 Tax=Pseudidiomarina halophila TaxID=1449799 RepID=UPI0036237A01
MSDIIEVAEQRSKVVEAYIQAFEDRNAEAVMALYADEATVEDPYGTEPIKGRDAIYAFIRRPWTSTPGFPWTARCGSPEILPPFRSLCVSLLMGNGNSLRSSTLSALTGKEKSLKCGPSGGR